MQGQAFEVLEFGLIAVVRADADVREVEQEVCIRCLEHCGNEFWADDKRRPFAPGITGAILEQHVQAGDFAQLANARGDAFDGLEFVRFTIKIFGLHVQMHAQVRGAAGLGEFAQQFWIGNLAHSGPVRWSPAV
jgi:hypothetical protein